MASTQQIKSRIRSVRSTRQITKAMELVAASKMRRAQELTLASRDYSRTAHEVLNRLRELTDVSIHPLFAVRPVSSRIIVVITSDRGLAGAYNSNILRKLTAELRSDQEQGAQTKVIAVGRQAAKFLSRVENVDVIGVYERFPEHPTIQHLTAILDTVKLEFTGDGLPAINDETGLAVKQKKLLPSVDAVDVLFTEYKSSIVQEVSLQRILPAAFGAQTVELSNKVADEIIFEPSPAAVLDQIVDRLVDVQLWQAFLESQASEQGARMMAMKTASDNAKDLIDDLTLAANTARQASITQELAEITGGAEAMK